MLNPFVAMNVLFFNNDSDQEKEMKNKTTKIYNVFKIGNFSLKKKVIHNIEFIEIERDLTESLALAKYMIYMDYVNKFKFPEEEILSIDNITIEENINEFVCSFLVCVKKNIAVFNEKY